MGENPYTSALRLPVGQIRLHITPTRRSQPYSSFRLSHVSKYPRQPFPRHGPFHHINCSFVDPRLCGLQSDFDQVERMPDDDCTKPPYSSSSEGAEAGEG